MNSRALLFFLFALLLAGGTTYAARSWLASQQVRPVAVSAKPVEQASVRILVAAADLGTGNFVRAQDLKWQSWPDDQVTAQYIRKPDPAAPEPGQDPLQSLVGAVVRQRIAAGEPVTSGRIIK